MLCLAIFRFSGSSLVNLRIQRFLLLKDLKTNLRQVNWEFYLIACGSSAFVGGLSYNFWEHFSTHDLTFFAKRS